jgi:hypothetical protein
MTNNYQWAQQFKKIAILLSNDNFNAIYTIKALLFIVNITKFKL